MQRQYWYVRVLCEILFIGALPLIAKAQAPKREVEQSVHQDVMPENAINLIEELIQQASKVKYYRETDGENSSYECKILWKNRQYSIEFYDDGSLMDIEKLIEFSELPSKARSNIGSYLEQEYQKSKIERLQQQYTAEEADENDEEVIEELIERDLSDLTIRYEMEAKTMQQGKIYTYEILFDDQGTFLERRKILSRSVDNILY